MITMKGVKERMRAAAEFVGADGGLHVGAHEGVVSEAEEHWQADLAAIENDHRLQEEVLIKYVILLLTICRPFFSISTPFVKPNNLFFVLLVFANDLVVVFIWSF